MEHYSPLKKENSATWDNMDETRRHDSKQNKPNGERYILHFITDMWDRKIKIK